MLQKDPMKPVESGRRVPEAKRMINESDFKNMPLSRSATAKIVGLLLQSARDSATSDEAWLFLQAAHIEGQTHLQLHTLTHLRMLRLAWRLRDGHEVWGQLWRLLLVPIGHLIGRLPLGNPGRSTVNALAPQEVPDHLQLLIVQARRQAISVA